MRTRTSFHARSGLSLVELTISLFVFSIVGYSLVGIVQVGRRSTETVSSAAVQLREMRETHSTLSNELQLASDGNILIEDLPDENHQVTFMHRIESGGNLEWGVFDKSLGANDDEQNRVGWSFRYTVSFGLDAEGEASRQLVRQLIDENGDIQDQEVVLDHINAGNALTPGFRVVRAGDMWEVRIGTDSTVGAPNQEMMFHVRTRN